MIFKPFVRSAYNYDQDEASDEAKTVNEDKSLTQQEFTEDADINTIVRRFGITGTLPGGMRIPEYGDYTGVSDFQSAMAVVIAAQDSFMELSGEVRARFQNDPQMFLEFCSREENAEEMRKLGLMRGVEKVVEAAPGAPGASTGEGSKGTP